MKLSVSSNAAFAVVLGFAATATGFSGTLAFKKVNGAFGRTTRSAATFVHKHPAPLEKQTRLYGILDDIKAEATSSANYKDNSDNNQAYEQLFEDLVFSTRDTATVIAEQLDACTDTDFRQYLESLEKDSTDDDERQALRDLLDAIDDVVKKTSTEVAAAAAQKKEEQDEAKRKRIADKANAVPTVKMTNADVLKRANAIDEAVVTAEASEDELPPDFIRDAKKEVGLAGFNNKGQMRVGGN